ncbi:MAG TPA: urate hydroxylase PuuD [Steroidobacteraceae bacterium]
MNPLTTVKWPLIIGFVLAVVIAALIDGGLHFNSLTLAALARWLHIIFGVFWIGLLYYFNAVQTPAMGAAAADKGGPGGAGINKYVAPRALLWFRWSALGTWLMGAWLLSQTPGRFVSAFTLGLLDNPVSRPNLIIGIGAWLGTIMLFNVWGLIWPNQKKILGMVPATDEQKASARKVALYASRTNFLLSIPMLMCMVGPTHGLPF